MDNIIQPVACEILDIKQESKQEYTFKVKTDIRPAHGQFLQLSIPKIGEAPISVSSFGDGWMEFTIRSVGKVTNEIFAKRPVPEGCVWKRVADGNLPEETYGYHYGRNRAGPCQKYAAQV